MGRLFLGCGFFSFPVLELDELPLDSGDFDFFFGLDPFFFFSLWLLVLLAPWGLSSDFCLLVRSSAVGRGVGNQIGRCMWQLCGWLEPRGTT